MFCARNVCLVPTAEPGLRDHKSLSLVYVAGGELVALGLKWYLE